jgi:TolC family type I secretion outer membrane protein
LALSGLFGLSHALIVPFFSKTNSSSLMDNPADHVRNCEHNIRKNTPEIPDKLQDVVDTAHRFGQILKKNRCGFYCKVLLNCAESRFWGSIRIEKSFFKVGIFVRNLGIPVLAFALLGSTSFSVHSEPQGETLKGSLQALVKSHKRILAARADFNKSNEDAEAAWKDWHPNFSATANIGYEKQVKPPGSVDTDMVPRNLDLSVTQKIWDFGATNANIRSAKLTAEKSSLVLTSTVQSVMLEGIQAHFNIIRATKLVEFAESSAANIKRQAELENARVQRGSGLSTDVLQAKTQLAGAESRTIELKGNLKKTLNRYQNVFGYAPKDGNKLKEPRLPLELLPTSITEAVEEAQRGNPQLASTQIDSFISRETTRSTRASSFFPTIEAAAESNFKQDAAGTVGSKQERLIKLEATYDLSLGMTAINTLRGTKQDYVSKSNTYAHTRDSIAEQARNAWDDLDTFRAKAELKHNQANIAAEFLELARRERQLGNRSLIDVLAGETALINASSDAASADTDVAIAVFTLLTVLGKLQTDIFE